MRTTAILPDRLEINDYTPDTRQANVVSGYVWDNSQRGIEGVNVTDLETGFTVQTNAEGFFQLPYGFITDELQFSHVSYQLRTLPVIEFKSYIELNPSTNMLDDVNLSTTKKSSLLPWLVGGTILIITIGIIASNSGEDTVKMKV